MSEANVQQDTDSDGSVLLGMAVVLSLVALYVTFDYGTGPLAAQELSWQRGLYGLVGVALLAYAATSFKGRFAA
jgi:hypothetical protein